MIHFVYKIPRHGNKLGKLIDKYALTKKWFPVPWRYGKNIPWRKPIKAPHSITFQLLNALSKKDTVQLYDMYEEKICTLKKGDKFLAQPMNSWEVDTYKDPSVYKITSRTLDAFPNFPDADKTLIMPYTHDPDYNRATKDLIQKYGKNLIIISHKYWTDSWDKSPIKNYVDNLLRVNMCISAEEYPVVKKIFNPKGERRFFYIGNTNYYKNTRQLEEIAKAVPGFEGGHIGRGEIKGWKKISDGADLTPEFMSRVAEEYDIFLNTSSADASPTTILEQMCFGFPIACTPESSYEYDSFTMLHVSDTKHNVEVIYKLQNMDEDIFFEQAKKNRQLAIENHNWEDFCKKVIDFVYNRSENAHGLFLVD